MDAVRHCGAAQPQPPFIPPPSGAQLVWQETVQEGDQPPSSAKITDEWRIQDGPDDTYDLYTADNHWVCSDQRKEKLERIRDAHKAALREHDAEAREPLVDALIKMSEVAYQTIIEHAGVELENLPNELQCICDDALAKVKQ